MFLPIEYNHICALLLETCETPAGHRIDVKSVPPAVGKRIIFPLCAPSFPTSCFNTGLQQMEAPPPGFPRLHLLLCCRRSNAGQLDEVDQTEMSSAYIFTLQHGTLDPPDDALY